MENTNDREFLSEDDKEWSSSESSDTHDEIEFGKLESTIATVDDDPEGLYAEEPLASAEWLEGHNKELRRIEERKQAMQNRLDRVLAESTW